MTDTARELLTTFDALSPADQQQVAAGILRRTARYDDLPEAALHQLADELFRSHDADEAAHANPSPR
jgi:hypothetical protein